MMGEPTLRTLLSPLLIWIAERLDRSLITVPDIED
jgi:hypothetical protein